MSTNTHDKEIVDLMARNRRGKMVTGVAAVVVIVVSVILMAMYFGSVAAVAP